VRCTLEQLVQGGALAARLNGGGEPIQAQAFTDALCILLRAGDHEGNACLMCLLQVTCMQVATGQVRYWW
jgi:hypothetical protein